MNDVVWPFAVHQNVAGAVVCALFAVITGTRPLDVGWRNYALIVAAAFLTAAAVIDYWFLHHGFFICCLIGFAIGYLADDVVLNLNATVPDFVKNSLADVFDWLRRWLGRILNK